MKKSEAGELFTKIIAKQLGGMQELIRWGIDTGHTTADSLRLTIEARKAKAKEMIESGLSQRQAAKALGVSHTQVQKDLTEKLPKTGNKVATKKERREAREKELAAKQVALPHKRYGVIVADPAWRFEPYSRETGMDRLPDNHYPTQSLDDITALDVRSRISAKDCVLFLWATAPMMPQALTVMAAWGFEYKSQCVWNKDGLGTGYWYRNKHELLLVGTKGTIPAPAPGTQFPSVIDAPVSEHSAKPEQFLQMIEAYFPNLPKIELNRRGPARAGWDAWGNEAEDIITQGKGLDDGGGQERLGYP